jgi:hypothetical protein
MTPYEAVYGQKANDGILVGANAVSEFIDEDQIEYLYENDSQTDIVAETDSQTPSQSDSQTDSQTDSATDSQTESLTELDTETDLQTDSPADLQTDVECETITHPDVSQTDIEQAHRRTHRLTEIYHSILSIIEI